MSQRLPFNRASVFCYTQQRNEAALNCPTKNKCKYPRSKQKQPTQKGPLVRTPRCICAPMFTKKEKYVAQPLPWKIRVRDDAGRPWDVEWLLSASRRPRSACRDPLSARMKGEGSCTVLRDWCNLNALARQWQRYENGASLSLPTWPGILLELYVDMNVWYVKGIWFVY